MATVVAAVNSFSNFLFSPTHPTLHHMESKYLSGFIGLALVGSASAQGLYNVGSEAQESMPLKWVVGTSVIYDDNVGAGGGGAAQSSFGVNPYVGLSFVSMTPQTTWDVYARLGLIYYLDKPNIPGMSDVSSQSRAGINLTHRFSERLRFSSRNFIAYELEPDYSYGYASSRQMSEYFYWQSDNSIGYRWTERFATYTGVSVTGATYPNVQNNDRFTWEAYNQMRYQLSPQTVVTGDYRYAQTTGNGLSSDSTDQYILLGLEQRFSPNTIGIIRAGIQLHDVNGGSSSSSPYGELALNSQVNQQLMVRAFARYGIENYDTVVTNPTAGLVEYNDRRTFRLGISSDYAVTQLFTIFGGVDYIPTSYQSGHSVSTPPFLGSVSDLSEDVINLSLGCSYKFNDLLTGTATYNYTKSSSDIAGQDYNRNRISLGLSAEF